jgi:LemA protein
MSKGILVGCGAIAALVVVIGLVAGMWGMGIYNTMISQQEGVSAAWSQVENVYQRRADLIPNLVETVKGYAKHEEQVFVQVTEARSKISNINVSSEILNDPNQFKAFQQAQGDLSSALSKLMVVVESYPELKANENFLALQSQLEGTENRIAVERKRFNEVAQGYNTYIRQVPNNFIAGLGGFKTKEYFQMQEGADVAPKVDF